MEKERETFYRSIPVLTIQGIKRYVEHHIPPGDFLAAVLANDLREAFGRADDCNRAAMFEIVSYCWNEIPYDCWGSPERVREWLEPTYPSTDIPPEHPCPACHLELTLCSGGVICQACGASWGLACRC